MRSHQPNARVNSRPTGAVRFKLGLVSLTALVLVTLPQVFSSQVGAAPRGPQGFLFTVTTTDDHNDFVCDGTDCTLREAIQAANNAPTEDTIDFAVTGVINLVSALPDISGSLAIEGPGPEMLTVRRDDSAGIFRIFNITTTGNVEIFGLSIIRGATFGVLNFGGGILNDRGTVTVKNCLISNSNGGIQSFFGTLTVIDSIITDNSGPGILSEGGGAVTVTNSTITGNVGPGVISDGVTLTVTKSTISNNLLGITYNGSGALAITNSTVSHNPEGGISCEGDGAVAITTSTISNNKSDNDGGGVFYHGDGALTVTNSTISGNVADGGGGGIFNLGALLTITNSTISGNTALGKMGGIRNGGGVLSGSNERANVKSSIIASNNAVEDPDVAALVNSGGFNLIGKVDGDFGFNATTDLAGTIASPRDPGLDPNGLQDNGGFTKTIALLCSSPAIDKGTSAGLTGNLTTDQRGMGFLRTLDDPLFPNAAGGDGTDIGAYELDTQKCNHPPVAQCKNIQLSADNNCRATITTAQIDNGSYDPDKGDSIALRSLDNSGPFGLGAHTVTLTVTDTHGATGSCTATVTVVDTTPPTLTCPPNVSVPATAGQCQAVVTYPNPTITDNCSTPTLIGCVPSSGTIFVVGTTTVTCTARDVANNVGSCHFMVVVLDTQPPTISCPANIITRTPNPGDISVGVNYPPPTASDNCGSPIVVCSPPSGSQFPLGITAVTCTATDGATSTASCTFTITVFDVCLQDETTRDTLMLNSQTGDYLFVRCGAGGFSLSGRGTAKVKGSIFALEHNASDRRVLVRLDDSVKRGIASVQYFPLATTFTITDRNTTDNSCSCE